MIQFNEGRFKCYRWCNDKWMEYIAWFDAPRSVRFVINDGRAPGNSAGLPADEFWTQFTTEPEFGICEIVTNQSVKKSNPLGLWINTKNDWPWRSTARSTAARFESFEAAALRLDELRAEAPKRHHPQVEERYVAMLKVEHLPPMMETEVAEVARHLETFIKSLQDTHRIMRGNLGDRTNSGAANIDNYVANRWQLAWEIVNGIRPMITPEDALDKRPHIADECFANADFGWQVKDADGWIKYDSEHKLQRVVYFEDESNPDGPSIKGTLFVEFWPDNEALKDCWLEWADNDDVLDIFQLGLRENTNV